MSTGDEAARKARAQRLREEMERLQKAAGSDKKPEEDTAPPESPREFIHRRMRELDEKEQRNS